MLYARGMAREGGQQTRSEAVHDRIRADILGGRLRPGQRLKFPELSERYGVSTGAVREALLRLAAKNLVSSEAHHGFQVTTVTTRGLADLCEVRVQIESLALTRAIGEGDLAWQSDVLAAVKLLHPRVVIEASALEQENRARRTDPLERDADSRGPRADDAQIAFDDTAIRERTRVDVHEALGAQGSSVE